MAPPRWALAAAPALVLAAGWGALQSSQALKIRIAVGLFGWDGMADIAREAVATRLLGRRPTGSRTEFLALLDTLADADEHYLSPTKRGIVRPDDIAEGHRMLTHLLRVGLETFLEADPLRPAMRAIVGPDKKVIGDNPDTFYYVTYLDVRESYLLRGRVTDEDYFSITVYHSPCEGCFYAPGAIGDINHHDLTLGADGAYSVLLSAARPDGYAGDWVDLSATPKGHTLQLLTRHYYERELSIQSDPTAARPVLDITLTDASGRAVQSGLAPAPTDADMARKLRAVRQWVHGHSTGIPNDPAKTPKWWSLVANQFGDPKAYDQESTQAGSGKGGPKFRTNTTGSGGEAQDIAYSAAPFRLGEDEALVVDGWMPDCGFANVVLWNRFLQTFDYSAQRQRLGRRTSLNRKQMRFKPGGAFRIVLAHEDPGPRVDNWLDTMGRPMGTLFFRFLLPKTEVTPPNATVVKFAALPDIVLGDTAHNVPHV